jgi:flavin-dependent dehydrogenase
VASRIRELPHSTLHELELRSPRGVVARVQLPTNEHCEIGVERRLMDAALLDEAKAAGVTVCEGSAVTGLERVARGWRVRVEGRTWNVPAVVGADGRNSTVARMTRRLPRARRGRVAVETHAPLPSSFKPRVSLWLYWDGYIGLAPLSDSVLSLCIVSTPSKMAGMQRQIVSELGLNPNITWNTIAPLSRPDAQAVADGLFLAGDAARVVEPFTGEGTYYAMRTGELAASCIAKWLRGEIDQEAAEREYTAKHHAVYRGRLWINQLARLAVTVPIVGSALIHTGAMFPPALRMLARRLNKIAD